MDIFNDFSIGLFALQLVILVILIFLLAKFAWKPIMEAVETREEGIKDALASAEQAKEEVANITEDNQRILKEARATRDGLLKEAKEMKETIINEAKDEAKAQAEKIMVQAKDAIEVEKQAAISSIKSQVAELSIAIAENVVQKELANDKDQLALVEAKLKDVTLN
jgi:F-type H+-transporting ATPase subunit b